MTTTRKNVGRTATGLLAGSLLLFPLAACSGAAQDDEGAATTTATTEDSGTEDSGTESTDGGAESTDGGTDGGSAASVDCSGTSCELSLSSGQEAEVLGTTVSFTSSEDGVANLQVGSEEVRCGEGESVSAGPLTMTCSTVTADGVTLEASLG